MRRSDRARGPRATSRDGRYFLRVDDTWSSQSPIELIDAIWNEVPDFGESYELPDGMLRTKLPAYDEHVVRECSSMRSSTDLYAAGKST